MTDGDPDATSIKEAGWRQGSILPATLVTSLVNEGALPEGTETHRWIVLSHSCDVTNSSFDREPHVELIPLAPIDTQDGGLRWMKNPRRFHVQPDGHTDCFEVDIHKRVVLPRIVLLNQAPDESVVLGGECISEIAHWVARRYIRTAFPDRFNTLCQPVFEKLRRRLKAKGELLTGLYVKLSDSGQTTEGKDYRLTVIGSVRTQIHEDPDQRDEAYALFDEIVAALDGQPGLLVEYSDLLSEATLSVDDLRTLRRLDLDDLSVRGNSISELAPEADM